MKLAAFILAGSVLIASDGTTPLHLAVERDDVGAAERLIREGADVKEKMAQLRAAYEPFVNGLALLLRFELPPVVAPRDEADNWQRSACMRRAPNIGNLPAVEGVNDHFD